MHGNYTESTCPRKAFFQVEQTTDTLHTLGSMAQLPHLRDLLFLPALLFV